MGVDCTDNNVLVCAPTESVHVTVMVTFMVDVITLKCIPIRKFPSALGVSVATDVSLVVVIRKSVTVIPLIPISDVPYVISGLSIFINFPFHYAGRYVIDGTIVPSKSFVESIVNLLLDVV